MVTRRVAALRPPSHLAPLLSLRPDPSPLYSQASLETEADAAVAKGLWKQVRSVAKEVKAELGLLGLGHGPVSRWDVEEQQQHLIDDLVKAENDDRRTLLLQVRGHDMEQQARGEKSM